MTRRYVLQHERALLVLAILLFGGAFAFFAHRAATNEVGLMINRAFHFDPEGASMFYGVLATFSAALVVGGVVGIINITRGVQMIVVTEGTISLPGAVWRRTPTTIRFDDITKARLEEVAGQTLLRLESPAGKVAIAKSHLTERDWNEFSALVLARVSQDRRLL